MSNESAFEQAFGGNSTPAATPEPVAPASPQTPTPATPPEPASAATPAPQPAAAEPAKPQEVIPFGTALEWRDDLKATKRELADLKARTASPQPIPSIQDEEAYTAHVNDLVNRSVVSERFNISESMAQEKHGVDAVKAAMDWGMQRSQESPAFAAEYMRQKHPIDWAVRQHKRDALMKDMGDDPDAWVRKRYAEINPSGTQTPIPPASQTPAAPQPTPPQQPLPTRSLASATSAGGVQINPVPGEAEAFKATFSR